MARLPIRPVKLPKDLAGQSNGALSPTLLRPVDGGKLHHLAAAAWKAMVRAAKSDGITLKPTSAADTFRPLEVQERGFLNRYDNTKRMSKPRTYRGKLYWLKPGNAPMAVPGTSNHGWGLAVDVANIDQAKVEWLLKNAASYGFSWELQNEPWHLRYVAGDKFPEAAVGSVAPQKKTVAAPAKKAPAKKTAKKAVKKAVKK